MDSGGDRCHSGGFLLRIMSLSWHPVPACTPRLRCRRAVFSCSSGEGNGVLQAKLFFFAATKIRIGCGRASPLRPLQAKLFSAASIRKSGPEIKNRCTQEGLNGEKLASIPKSEPEIKNRCTQESLNGEKLTSIPKSEPEIKNRCSYKNRRRNYSSLQLRKLESDAEDRCRYESSRRNHSSLQRRNLNRTRNSLQQSPLQAKLFFFAASKIRI